MLLLSWQYHTLIAVMLPHKKSSNLTCQVQGVKAVGFLRLERRRVVGINGRSAWGSLGCVYWLLGYLKCFHNWKGYKCQMAGWLCGWLRKVWRRKSCNPFRNILWHVQKRTTQSPNQLPTVKDSEMKPPKCEARLLITQPHIWLYVLWCNFTTFHKLNW